MAVSADLGETLESVMNELVASGRYHSKSEVLREGVRLVQEREARLAALPPSVDQGLTCSICLLEEQDCLIDGFAIFQEVGKLSEYSSSISLVQPC